MLFLDNEAEMIIEINTIRAGKLVVGLKRNLTKNWSLVSRQRYAIYCRYYYVL